MSFEQYCLPQTLADLHFADQSVATQISNIAKGKIDSGFVLYGPPGTGKSVAAKLVADARNASDDLLFEVPFVFEGKNLCNLSELGNTLNALLGSNEYPFIVINEFDQMPTSALNSLQAFWNTHSTHCGLALTTNRFAAISLAMRSRLIPLEVQCPPADFLLPKAMSYLQQKGKSLQPHRVQKVLAAAGNDMRVRIRAIDQLAA
ncbi:AAA family ATPase [Tateyamaria sp.]|uniref:AAA family ATPase n=1 Tax=Tateyamaria sp. TaxID=1929288 RepID=UPI00329EECFE